MKAHTLRLAGLLISLLLTSLAAGRAAAQSTGQVGFSVYLPVLVRGLLPAPSQPANFLMPYYAGDSIMTNKTPQVAVDAAGGLHVVYTANSPDPAGQRPAYYAYCAGSCASGASFATVGLGDQVVSAQLAIDPASQHPRLLLTVQADPQNPGVYQYLYGECNAPAPCAAWTLTPVLPAPAQSYRFPSDSENNQSFALDAQGRPRFVYHSKDSYWATGSMFYRYCNSACTNAAHWSQSLLGDGEWQNPSLAFAADGQARLAFTALTHDASNNVLYQFAYLECSAACQPATQSGPVVLAETQTAPLPATFALRVDGGGRPHLALYPGSGGGGTLTPDRLYYLECSSDNCATPQGQWTITDLGLPGSDSSGAYGLDLALDKQNRPRVVYHVYSPAVDELGYTWCNTGCSDTAANWTHQLIASAAATDQELGHIRYSCPDCLPPVPGDCLSYWDAGYWPSLALDSLGNVRVAYEVALLSGGGACQAGTLARFTRLAILDRP